MFESFMYFHAFWSIDSVACTLGLLSVAPGVYHPLIDTIATIVYSYVDTIKV